MRFGGRDLLESDVIPTQSGAKGRNLALRFFMNIRDSSFGLGRRLLKMTASKSLSGACLAALPQVSSTLA
jgi:hypothetical protein